MKRMTQLFTALFFIVLAHAALAACPSNLTAEQMIDCIIAEADCQQARFFRQDVASASAPDDVTMPATSKLTTIASKHMDSK